MRNSLRWWITASSLMLGATLYLLLTHTRWGVAFFQSPLGLLTLLFIAFIMPTLVFFALNRIQSTLVGTKEPVTQPSQETQECTILSERDQIILQLLEEFVQIHGSGDKGLLTKCEWRVLRLVAQGLTNAEIAAALCITENTVKYHLKNILAKLRLRNRTQVVAWAAQHRYLQGEEQDEGLGRWEDRGIGGLNNQKTGRQGERPNG